MDPELIKILLGGGGIGAVVLAVGSYLKDRRRDCVVNEDTALSRLHADYDRKAAEASKAWRIVQWYRHHYPLLWLAYVNSPESEKDKYPPTPPPEIDN